MHKMYFKVHYLASDNILYPTSMSQCHMYDFHNSTDILVHIKLHRYVVCVIAICLISNLVLRITTQDGHTQILVPTTNISAFSANSGCLLGSK